MKSKHHLLFVARIVPGIAIAGVVSLQLFRSGNQPPHHGTKTALQAPAAITFRDSEPAESVPAGAGDAFDPVTLADGPGTTESPERSSLASHGNSELLQPGLVEAEDPEKIRFLAENLVALDEADAIEVLAEAHHRAKTADRKALIASSLKVAPGIEQEAREIITSIVASPHGDDLRGEAADAVARFANPDTVAHLRELFEEPDATESARAGIVETVREIRNPAAAGALGELINGADPDLAEAALEALRRMPSDETFRALVSAARRPASDPILNERVLDSISAVRISDPAALEALLVEESVNGPLHAAIELALRSSRSPLPPHRR